MTTHRNRFLPPSEDLLQDKEACDVLGIKNPKTLANWRYSGKHKDLEYIQIGRSIRYRLGALQAFKARHTVNKSCDYIASDALDSESTYAPTPGSIGKRGTSKTCTKTGAPATDAQKIVGRQQQLATAAPSSAPLSKLGDAA